MDESVKTPSSPPVHPAALPPDASHAMAPGTGEAPALSTATVRRFAASLSRLARAVLIGVAAFNAISAVGGGIAVLFTDGLGMPRAFLAGSPFVSFVLPAVLLLAVVGGTQAVATALLLLRRPSSLFWAALAGFTMVTWILAETAIIRGFGLLQALYYLTGVTELVLVLALLGIVSWLPRIDQAVGYRRPLAAHG